MRILTVTHFFESHGGGIEIVAGHLARQLGGLGHTAVWSASASDAPSNDAHVEDVPLKTFDPLEKAVGLPMPVPFPYAAARLWREVGRSDGVIIHDGLYVTSIIAACSARWHRKPYILMQHIGAIPFASRVLRSVMRLANLVVTRPMMRGASQTIFISHTVARQFASMSWRTAPKVLFNGVDRERFGPISGNDVADAKSAFDLAEGRPTILFVGRFVEKKGLSILQAIARAMPDYDFVMAGAGAQDPTSWALPNVRVLGTLRPEKLAQLYRGVDALLLPSTGEGYPLVIQEAMASGLPVFCGEESAAADPGAAPFLVGLPVDLSAPKACAERFVDEIRRHHLSRSQAASVYAIETYDWRANAVQLAAMFETFCGVSDVRSQPNTALENQGSEASLNT